MTKVERKIMGKKKEEKRRKRKIKGGKEKKKARSEGNIRRGGRIIQWQHRKTGGKKSPAKIEGKSKEIKERGWRMGAVS